MKDIANDSSGFVILADYVPSIVQEIRYYSTYNFIGDRIDGYEEPAAFLTRKAARALKSAANELIVKGYRLKVFDAYRPAAAVKHFMLWGIEDQDIRMKPFFYPELEKQELFAKGYIASISSIDTGTYGNATFMISDDGTEANALTCYRSYSLDNQKFTSEDEITVGDEVIICGKLVNYRGETPEFSGNVYIFSRKSAAEANQPGTLLNPFTPEQAVAYVDGGGTEAVYIKGIVSELYKGGFDPNYGNGSFYISDNGTKYGDPLKDFEAYQVNYIGNRKWTEADPQIAVGDVVVIYGPVTKYGDIRETKGKGAAYIYSLNGKTE